MIDSQQLMEILTHISCLLVLLSFLVRDMLLLRALAILSSLVWIGAMIGTHHLIVASLLWNTVFVLINVWQIFSLLKESRDVDFNPEERGLFESLFIHFKPGEFVRILRQGNWIDLPQGTVLVKKGTLADGIWILCSGEAVVLNDDASIKARLGINDMIGEMSYLTGTPATTSVQVSQSGRGLFWTRDSLNSLFREHPTLKIAFQSIISSNLAEKLKR
jgi:hypothetical protein